MQNGFTLVELLVVIAVITILAAMLLPTLEKSLEQSKRISCLNDKKQLGLTTFLFGDEHRDLVPHPIYNWQSGNRTMSTQQDLNRHFNYSIWEYGNHAMPLGVLSAFGYVDTPSILFCPSTTRDPQDLIYAWDKPQGAAIWKSIRNRDNNFGGCFRLRAGVADYFLMAGPWTVDLWTKGYAKPNLTLLDISNNWQQNTTVGPILYSCANEATSATAWGGEIDSQGVAKAGSTFGIYADGHGISHATKGVNAVFVDGSGRWIPREEVRWAGEGFLMANHYKLAGNLNAWANNYATIAKPR